MSIGCLTLLLMVDLYLPVGRQFVISAIEGPRPSVTKFDAFFNFSQSRARGLVLKKSYEAGEWFVLVIRGNQLNGKMRISCAVIATRCSSVAATAPRRRRHSCRKGVEMGSFKSERRKC